MKLEWRRWFERCGATQSSAVLRIALVLIAWARFGESMVLTRDPSLFGIGFRLGFWIGTTALLLGWRTQIAAVLSAACVVWMVYGVGGGEWLAHNTVLLAHSFVILSLLPCGYSLSLDRVRIVRAAIACGVPVPSDEANVSALWLLRLQVSAVYLWSAIDKMSAEFLSGYRLERILRWHYFGSRWQLCADWSGVCEVAFQCASWLVVALELGLAVFLWFPRWRREAMITGVIMHALFYVMLPVSTFSITMIALYVAFIPPEEFKRLLRVAQD